MYAAVTTFIFMCIGATTLADHHQPCHSPSMTGTLSVFSLNTLKNTAGDYTYDHVAKKLRLKSNENSTFDNSNKTLDVLMFFKEGFFYVIDGSNQTCEKKHLQSGVHPLEIPSAANMLGEMNLGSPTIAVDGLKLNIWTGAVPETEAFYSLSVSVGCLPISAVYLSKGNTLIISNLNTETGIKDHNFLTLPPFCEGVALEETPQGTVNSFFNLFT